MNKNLTIIQNFILNNKKKEHLYSDLGLKLTANVLGECNFIVNYKGEDFEEIKTLYEQYIPKLTIFNWKEDENFTWVKSTYKLLNLANTQYIFYLTEDRIFNKINRDEFNEIIIEVVKNNIGWMCIGKLPKYSNTIHPQISKVKNKPPYLNNDNHIYTYLSKNSPYGVLSIDSIFRKDVLQQSLDRIINNKSKTPHVLEQEPNWLTNGMPNLLCAVPKKTVITSDDDPEYKKLIG